MAEKYYFCIKYFKYGEKGSDLCGSMTGCINAPRRFPARGQINESRYFYLELGNRIL